MPQHFGFVVGPGIAPSVYEIKKVGHGSSIQSINFVGVDLERALEEATQAIALVGVGPGREQVVWTEAAERSLVTSGADS